MLNCRFSTSAVMEGKKRRKLSLKIKRDSSNAETIPVPDTKGRICEEPSGIVRRDDLGKENSSTAKNRSEVEIRAQRNTEFRSEHKKENRLQETKKENQQQK